MKLLKLFLALVIIVAFASCNTKNRPKIIDTVHGTPTNADTVLLRKQMKPGSEKHPIPHNFVR